MRVLIPLHGYIGWNGGLDLVRLIVSAIDQHATSGDIEVAFALPEQSTTGRLLTDAVRRWRILRAGSTASHAGGQSSLLAVASEITAGHAVLGCSADGEGILRAAATAQADIIFPSMLSLARSRVPRIGYLYDFQHRHLPDLFSRRVRRKRDRQFERLATHSDGIMVNSRSAARDAVDFLGVSRDRLLVMPFTPYVRPWWFHDDPMEVQRRHGICGPYVLVCNHFWKHKDHVTALKAFASLRNVHSGGDLQLVLTGDPIDHRDPQHYGRLLAQAESLGILGHCHFLGLIPKRDQIALVRGCRALWQPTLFEGGPGGGSTYEAVGLGVPAVISDIAINREIGSDCVTFFESGNPLDLAAKTVSLLQQQPPRPDRAQLDARSDASLQALADAIIGYLSAFIAKQNG